MMIYITSHEQAYLCINGNDMIHDTESKQYMCAVFHDQVQMELV